MNAMVGVRQIVRSGPADCAEARRIVEMALEHIPVPNPQWENRLLSALMEMLICRQLHQESIGARIAALAVVDEIQNAQDMVAAEAKADVNDPGGNAAVDPERLELRRVPTV